MRSWSAPSFTPLAGGPLSPDGPERAGICALTGIGKMVDDKVLQKAVQLASDDELLKAAMPVLAELCRRKALLIQTIGAKQPKPVRHIGLLVCSKGKAVQLDG